jgi:hypothetical protein
MTSSPSPRHIRHIGTSTFLDGAAILGTLEALDSRGVDQASSWGLQCAVETTTMLLLAPKTHLSPIPELYNAPVGPYGRALALLSEWVDQHPVEIAHRSQALQATQRWGRRNTTRLGEILMSLHEDASYHRWIEWLRRNQWEDHVKRHGGLFEKAFIGPISRVLNVSSKDLLQIWADSAVDLRSARTSRHAQDERLDIVQDAFTLSTLLRGRYYESLAVNACRHVVHHPLRYPILRHLPADRQTRIPLSNTASYLAVIILAASFNARRSERPAQWVGGLHASRAAIYSGELDASPKDSDEIAVRIAAREASRIGLQTHPQWVDHLLNASVSAGIGGIAALLLSSFEAVGASFAADIALEASGMIGRATHRVSARESRLETIARLGAGRITSQWRIAGPSNPQRAGN